MAASILQGPWASFTLSLFCVVSSHLLKNMLVGGFTTVFISKQVISSRIYSRLKLFLMVLMMNECACTFA